MDYNLVNAPKKLLPAVKAKLRQKVARLSERQLKRLKMNYRDALRDELEELNCSKALEIFDKILSSDQRQQKSFEDKINRKLLEKIFNVLKEFEEKSQESEIEAILNLVKDIWEVDEKFDWLIEILLIFASQLVKKYDLEGSKIDILTKYLHGTSMSEKLRWFRAAVILLESAFQTASIHEEWIVNLERLCVLISYQLSNTLTKFSREVRTAENNIEGALKLSRRSLNVVRMYVSDKSISFEVDAEIEYAACHFDNEDFKKALNHYGHALTLAHAGKFKQKCSEILIEIGKCHLSLNEINKFENYLLMARDLADELKLFDLEGEINATLGEYFNKSGNFEKVSRYLTSAVNSYKNANNMGKVISISAKFAEIKAKNNFNALVDTILRSDKAIEGRNREYEKLVLWHDRKYPLTNRHHDFYRIDEEDQDLNVFIKKYYDPDEIIKIQ